MKTSVNLKFLAVIVLLLAGMSSCLKKDDSLSIYVQYPYILQNSNGTFSPQIRLLGNDLQSASINVAGRNFTFKHINGVVWELTDSYYAPLGELDSIPAGYYALTATALNGKTASVTVGLSEAKKKIGDVKLAKLEYAASPEPPVGFSCGGAGVCWTGGAYSGCRPGSVRSSVVTGGSEGFSCKASFLVELSERLVVEPVSSSETTVWVLSEAVPWIWVVSFAAASGRLVSVPGFSSQVSVPPEASVEAGMNSLSGSRVSNQAPASTATQSADNPQMVKVLFLSVGLFFFMIDF